MTTKIAILGSCVSEDWYHHQSVRHRLDVKLEPLYQPSTLLSAMAAPIDVEVDPGTKLSAREADALRMDFDKSFLAKLAGAQPDVLIVEFLRDGRYGSMQVGDSWISITYLLKRSPMIEKFADAKILKPSKNPEAYCELFRSAARALGAFLEANLPATRIFLHQARWSEFYLDETGELQPYKPWEQNEFFIANLRLMELERIFSEEVDCENIGVDDIPVFADSRHIWGPASDHYFKPYYSRFTDKLRSMLNAHTIPAARPPEASVFGGTAAGAGLRSGIAGKTP